MRGGLHTALDWCCGRNITICHLPLVASQANIIHSHEVWVESSFVYEGASRDVMHRVRDCLERYVFDKGGMAVAEPLMALCAERTKRKDRWLARRQRALQVRSCGARATAGPHASCFTPVA